MRGTFFSISRYLTIKEIWKVMLIMKRIDIDRSNRANQIPTKTKRRSHENLGNIFGSALNLERSFALRAINNTLRAICRRSSAKKHRHGPPKRTAVTIFVRSSVGYDPLAAINASSGRKATPARHVFEGWILQRRYYAVRVKRVQLFLYLGLNGKRFGAVLIV